MAAPTHTATDPKQELAGALRAAASRASELAGGGPVLVFAGGEIGPHDVRLRSAAGFALPEEARQAGLALAPLVRSALGGPPMIEVADPPALGKASPGSLRIYPLGDREIVRGALAVGWPEKPSDAEQHALLDVANYIALHLDHARLAEECASLRAVVERGGPSDGEQSEEVLRLSEALFAQDIELLRSHEKLGKIERLKDDFIEKMSRELRTPLNSIIEAVISVLTGEDAALSETAKSSLRGALDEGSAFLRTLQNILDLWRIKQGELPVETQDVNFPELVDEAIFSVQDSVADKPVRIDTDLEDPFPRLRTDLTKLNQILFLLLDNAVKFTPEGMIRIRASVADSKLSVSVEDEGIGICHDDQQFVFEEFYQVDDSSSQQYRGAGLGLTLVRDLVTLLEGEISVKSDIGRGTTVSVSVPLQAA